jgi:hypothetical protein
MTHLLIGDDSINLHQLRVDTNDVVLIFCRGLCLIGSSRWILGLWSRAPAEQTQKGEEGSDDATAPVIREMGILDIKSPRER